MQNDGKSSTMDDIQARKGYYDRRKKRIKRIKTAIIVIATVFLIVPTVFCIILGIKVNQLQQQVNELLRIHEEYGISDGNGDHYAYAAMNSNLKKPADDPEVETGQVPKEDSSTSIADLNSDQGKRVNNKNAVENKNSSEGAKDEKDTASASEVSSKESGIYSGKKVYLTFDDGPSIYTGDILDVLKEYQVNATFFVVGKTDAESKKMYQRIVKEGHTLGMHSYSHKYSEIYNSIEDFDKDFTKLRKLLYDTTGYKPSIFRFPGGSNNHVNKSGMEDFIRYLNEASVVYFDWNVLNGDATGKHYTKEQLIDNVLNGIDGKQNAIVLMHDAQTKKTTVDSLPGLLDELLSEGAEILALNKDVPPIQMIDADSVK